MRCDDFQKRWQTLLDERQSPELDDLLCAHAAMCEECGELLEIQSVLFREIELSKKYYNPASLTPAYRVPSSRSKWHLAKSLIVGLAVAGSLLILVIPAWRISANRRATAHNRLHVKSAQRSMPGPTIWVAKTPASSPVNQSPVNQSPVNQSPVNQSPVNQSPVNQSPVNQSPAVSGPADTRMAAEQEALRKLMQNMAAKLSDVPEEQLEPLDRIAGGFKPLANTLGAAWDALRRSISSSGRRPTLNEPQATFGWPGRPALA